MVKSKHILNKIIIMIFIIMMFISINVFASNPTTINPDDWKPDDLNTSDVQEIVDTSKVIVDIIRAVGIIVTVVVIIVMGIKYMLGSIEERAEYKKSMLPYLLGVFIFFCLSQILAIIINFSTEI